MAKAPQKSKEAKAKAATGSSKKSKKKWSKGKSRDKLQNLCLFDKPTYDRLMKEVPKYKVNYFSWPTFIFWPFVLQKCVIFRQKWVRSSVNLHLGHHSINCLRQNEDPWLIGPTCHQATSSRRQNQARNPGKDRTVPPRRVLVYMIEILC